jgi:hypothetical protein
MQNDDETDNDTVKASKVSNKQRKKKAQKEVAEDHQIIEEAIKEVQAMPKPPPVLQLLHSIAQRRKPPKS